MVSRGRVCTQDTWDVVPPSRPSSSREKCASMEHVDTAGLAARARGKPRMCRLKPFLARDRPAAAPQAPTRQQEPMLRRARNLSAELSLPARPRER
mmetsp:Transcript_54540/g.145592  ORF Transcript_54540/g.145592 Transcript_54540/m.145592 type:complete len:96 (-) Transcript_54540:201-488(-)